MKRIAFSPRPAGLGLFALALLVSAAAAAEQRVTLRGHHGTYVVAEANGQANANRRHAKAWETFTLVTHPDGRVSLRGAHGKYLVAERDGTVNANRKHANDWEKWRLVRHGDGQVSLRSHHGKWLVAESDGRLNANRKHANAWEKFRLTRVGAPKPPQPVDRHPRITLRGHHGTHVVAEANGQANANRRHAKAWETFTLVTHPDGRVSLRGAHGKYLVAERDGTVNANRKHANDWEKWRLVRHGDGRVSLRSHHGKWLVAESDGRLNANRKHANAWEKFRMTVVGGDARRDVARHDGRIQLVGTHKSMTPAEFRRELAGQGLTLVQRDRLRENECAVVYPRADADDIAAEFALLTCNKRIGDRVVLSTAAVHGGCDASNVRTQGAGGACSIGVASTRLTADLPNGRKAEYTVDGPNAGACGLVSTERVCANAGADLASTSFGVKDARGNGIGVGVSSGVGAGLGGGYEDGVLSASFDLKIIAGASISFSVNVEDAGQAIYSGSKTAFMHTGKGIVAVGQGMEKGVTVVGENVVKGAEAVGNGVKDGVEAVGDFFGDIF